MFIATGQDVANDDDKENYYLSITIPSLIAATHGGGTGLLHNRSH